MGVAVPFVMRLRGVTFEGNVRARLRDGRFSESALSRGPGEDGLRLVCTSVVVGVQCRYVFTWRRQRQRTERATACNGGKESGGA